MKKAVLLMISGIALWLVLPTGDPSDIFITLPLIGMLGIVKYAYVAASLVILYILISAYED